VVELYFVINGVQATVLQVDYSVKLSRFMFYLWPLKKANEGVRLLNSSASIQYAGSRGLIVCSPAGRNFKLSIQMKIIYLTRVRDKHDLEPDIWAQILLEYENRSSRVQEQGKMNEMVPRSWFGCFRG
jgi:hypothetical protein